MGNSRMHKTNDSVNNLNIADDDGFAFLMRSPEREYNDDDEIIEIDEGDEELAQIIRRIIVWFNKESCNVCINQQHIGFL